MAWKIKAKYYEACNCAYGCPCNMNGFPTHGFCEGSIGVLITEGNRDGVDLKGAKVAGAVKWPGAIHEGNGTMAVFIDGNTEQQAALVEILTAKDPGLPWEILSATISEIHGPFFEKIDITERSRWKASRIRCQGTSTKHTWSCRPDSSSPTPRLRPRP